MNRDDWLYAYCVGLNVLVTFFILSTEALMGGITTYTLAATAWGWGCFGYATYRYVRARRAGEEVRL